MNKMKELVSIIVPFYNAKATLASTIESLKSQTYSNVEILLINDESIDDSVNIANRIIKGDCRFSIINQKKSGPAQARIKGLLESKGEFVFFLDSDDLLVDSAIEIMVDEIKQRDLDVVIAEYTTFVDCPTTCSSDAIHQIYMSKNDLLRELASCRRIQNFIWGKLFKREIILSTDFDGNKLLGEDIATMYKIFDRCSSGVFLEGRPLVFYRHNSSSITKNLNYKKLNDYCNALIEKSDFYLSNHHDLYSLCFNSLVDYWFLITLNYDFGRIRNVGKLRKHINNSCHGIKNKLRRFVAYHPKLARLILKKSIAKNVDSEKKRIAVVNTYNRMSTGNIAKSICDGVADKFITKLFYGRLKDKWDNDSVFVGENKLWNLLNNAYVKISGNIGGAHKSATRKLIKELKKFNPDIVHLHNIHGNYLNYSMLFNYLKDKNVVITMHDCFWLTGRCAHFIDEKVVCSEWKTGCQKCPYKHLYMATLLFDKAKNGLELKNKFLAECKNVHLVALSNWQKNLFNRSDISLIPNGFDFKKVGSKNNLNRKRKLIIGVSQVWNKAKGIDDFNYLAERLNTSEYEIILVGKKPKHGIAHRNIRMLGLLDNDKTRKLIGEADIFVNPTYVDTFPTVLIESLFSGTPIITYDVGGCRDIVGDCGVYVNKGDKESLLDAICNFSQLDFKKIVERSELFSKESMISDYKKLFLEILNGK